MSSPPRPGDTAPAAPGPGGAGSCDASLPGHAVPGTVYVVDDDVSVRESLEALIRTCGWNPQTFPCAQDFLRRPLAAQPCCLVLDVSMPDLDGLELQQRVSAEQSRLPIIFITGHGDVPTTVRAKKAGAVEFLTKPVDSDVLVDAIAAALERSRVAIEHDAQVQALRLRYASLSVREREVMALVVAGLLNKQVGGRLGISEITVKAHRGSAMRKMMAASLPDLVNMAARLGLAGQPRDEPPAHPSHPGPRAGRAT